MLLILANSGILEQRPDLVVSGTNDGSNYGPAAPFSETVGSTIAAIRAGLPGVAMSTKPPVDDESDPQYTEHLQNVASFAVNLIDRLKTYNPGPDVLPKRTALNVNYPPLSPEQVQGLTIAVQGRYSSGMLAFEEISPGVYLPTNGPPAPDQEEVPGRTGQPSMQETLALSRLTATIRPIITSSLRCSTFSMAYSLEAKGRAPNTTVPSGLECLRITPPSLRLFFQVSF